MGEESFLFWLRKRLACKDASVLVGAGDDDCAHLRADASGRLAVTTDTLLEGTHFTPEDDPLAIGWKTVAVNVSDLAASGCTPRWATVNLGLRRGVGERWAKMLLEGMIGCARTYDMRLVGGDTTSGDGPSSISLTAIGVPIGARPLLRSEAKAGDSILLTGALGGSLVAGRHLKPIPRLPEIRTILERVDVHACIDISDGLALDAHRLCTCSGLGCELEKRAIPLHPDAHAAAAQSGRSAHAHAFEDGEDFELLLTLPEEAWNALNATYPKDGTCAPLTRIGTIEEEPGVRLLHEDGHVSPLPMKGYEHAW